MQSKIWLYFLLSLIPLMPLECALVPFNGKCTDARYAPTMSVSEHFERGYQLVEEKNWERALPHFITITKHFPNSPFCTDAFFYAGACRYFLGQHDLANTEFSKYLTQNATLHHFEKVFAFKLRIADSFAAGGTKRLFGWERMPFVIAAKEDAIKLYDEIIGSLPSHDLCVQALYGKGALLSAQRKYKEAIETLVLLIRRFPKSTLAADSFVKISDIYREEGKLEAQNPDLLALARVNFERFRRQFPGDQRHAVVEGNLFAMKEVCAEALHRIGEFYYRKGKLQAAKIYYLEAVKRYGETTWANKSRQRIDELALS